MYAWTQYLVGLTIFSWKVHGVYGMDQLTWCPTQVGAMQLNERGSVRAFHPMPSLVSTIYVTP